MRGVRRIELIGNTGSDAQLAYTTEGVARCKFSVAVNERYTAKDGGEPTERTVWFSVTAWRNLAEVCGQYVKKGMLVAVWGKPEAHAYLDKAGQPAASLDVTADQVLFLSRAEESGQPENAERDTTDIPF